MNKGDLNGIKRDGWATYHHFCSENGNQNHNDCGVWCSYKKSGQYNPRNPYLPKLMECLKPIYETLLSDDNLKRCLAGKTTNTNESFNWQIWKRAGKLVVLGRVSLSISIFDAIICKNESFSERAKIFERLGFVAGNNFKLCKES